MSTLLTEKENVMRCINGQIPEWVPNYNDCFQYSFAPYSMEYWTPGKRSLDFFGVEWITNDANSMCAPDRKILEDINDWRDFVRFPEYTDSELQAIAKEIADTMNPDLASAFMPCHCTGTLLLPIMNMMGFEEALMALMEEPEACMEFFDETTKLYERTARAMIPVLKPDIFYMNDDMATARSPFVSMSCFREMFAPFFKRTIDLAHEFDLPVMWHMCGKAEPLMEDLFDMGVKIWEVAQPSNDLKRLREKYGKSIVFAGGWDSEGPEAFPGATEEVVRAGVRKSMDNYAQDGCFIFWNLGSIDPSPDAVQKTEWSDDEARKYGRTFYK